MPKKLPELLSYKMVEEETSRDGADGISRWTIRDWVAKGMVSAIRPPGTRRVYIDRQDLIRVLESWKETASDV